MQIMVSIWIFLMYVMVDVMGRGHGGDGAEDPPHPFGRGEGQHEMDCKYYYNIFIYSIRSFIIKFHE